MANWIAPIPPCLSLTGSLVLRRRRCAAPPALRILCSHLPVLTHWANLCRTSGAREVATEGRLAHPLFRCIFVNQASHASTTPETATARHSAQDTRVYSLATGYLGLC